MPVVVSCSCGKRLRVPDTQRGKRVRCTGCGDPISVPREEEAEAPAPAPAPAAAPAVPPGMVRFTCECGKVMQAKAAYAGRNTQCPACKAQVQIPEEETENPDEGIRAEKPAAKRAAAASSRKRNEEEEEDRESADEEEEEERPSKKKAKKSSSMLPLILVGVAGLLFVCCGGGSIASYFIWFRGDSHYAMVPANAQGFASVRLADMVKAPGGQKLMQKAKQGGTDPFKEMQDGLGLTSEDIELATFVLNDFEKVEDTSWIVVSTTSSCEDKILKKMSGKQDVTFEGKKYYTGTFPGNKGGSPTTSGGKAPVGSGGSSNNGCLYFASGRLFVAAPNDKAMKKYLTFLANKPKGPLEDAISAASSSKHHWFVGFSVPAGKAAEGKAMAQMFGPAAQQFLPLMDVQSGMVMVDMTEPAAVEIRARYPNDNQAKDAKKLLDQAKNALGLFVGQAPPKDKALYEGILNSVTTEQSGPTVIMKLKVDSSIADNLPAGGMPGPGPGPRPGPNPGPGPVRDKAGPKRK